MTDPAIKAFLFNTRAKIALDLAGAAKFDRALAAMSESTQTHVRKPIPAADWVPLADNHDFLTQMLAIGYDGDMSKVTQQGQLTQMAGARSIYKVFLRFLNPAHIVARGPAYYKQAYRDNGEVRVEKVSEAQVRVHYEHLVLPSPAFFEHQRGGLIAICQLTRVREFDVTGVAEGVFDISWKL